MNSTTVARVKPTFSFNYTVSQASNKKQPELKKYDGLADYYRYGRNIFPSIVAWYNPITHNCSFSLEQLHNLDRLDEIYSLTDNWDGYGSKRIDSSVIEKCKQLIICLQHQPIIFPTARDSIQMQFELEDKSYLEFEVFSNHIESLMVPKRVYKDAISRIVEDGDINTVKSIIKEFYERAD